MEATNNVIRKQIDIPVKTAASLMVLAALSGQKPKGYIENLIISHVEKEYPKQLKKTA